MKNIRKEQLKKCIALEGWEFEKLLNQVEPGCEVEYSLDGITISKDDEDVDNNSLYRKIARYYDVDEVTSVHIDDCDNLLVWIVYKDFETKPVGELNYREKMLLGMNEIITSLNNESKIGSWLSGGVPDGSSVDEILEFANDDKDFAYMASLFLDIIKDKDAYNGGIYVKGLPLITDESRKAQ